MLPQLFTLRHLDFLCCLTFAAPMTHMGVTNRISVHLVFPRILTKPPCCSFIFTLLYYHKAILWKRSPITQRLSPRQALLSAAGVHAWYWDGNRSRLDMCTPLSFGNTFRCYFPHYPCWNVSPPATEEHMQFLNKTNSLKWCQCYCKISSIFFI